MKLMVLNAKAEIKRRGKIKKRKEEEREGKENKVNRKESALTVNIEAIKMFVPAFCFF